MQKKKVKEVARKYGIDIVGLTIKIQRSEKLLALLLFGSTDYKNIGRIDLFPNAFIDEEQLVRILVYQLQEGEEMKWIEHLEAIAQGEKLGNCPFCNGTKVDCGFVIDNEVNRMGHGAIWCNDCLHGYHLSRIRVSDNMKMQDIPLNIKFD